MGRTTGNSCLTALCVMAVASCVQGCGGGPISGVGMSANLTERECLIRAMYFESYRSSDEGLMAVGTVVMNRVADDRYPDTICGVVGQHRQFASGVLRKKMSPREMGRAEKAADRILRGERYAPIGSAMHFHMASIRIPYRVQYVGVAGGNAFYLKSGRRDRRKTPPPEVAFARDDAPDDAWADAPTDLRSDESDYEPSAYDGPSAAFAGEQSLDY